MNRLLTTLTALLLAISTFGQGIPFIRNYSAEEYNANNINFDIETDELGNVFVANFEGLLYYDYAEWRILRTPGISRITVVYKATDNTIWVGGYNYFGKVVRKDNGDIALKGVGGSNLFRGEVEEIFERDGELQFLADNGVIYKVKDDKVTVKKKAAKESFKTGMLDVVDVGALESGFQEVIRNDSVLTIQLGKNLRAIIRKNSGIVIADDNSTLFTITDANGLCSNNIAYATYDGRGHLWGATGKGIFVIQIPTAFTRFTSREGLPLSTTISIEELNGNIYAGTEDGLYRQQGFHFVSVPKLPHACWELKKSGNTLLAATADGIFRLYPDGLIRQITTGNTMAVLEDGSQIYSGEANGIYLMETDGRNKRRVCYLENVRKIVKDNKGTIWAQSLYGVVWYKKPGSDKFVHYVDGEKAENDADGEKAENMKTIVMTDSEAIIVDAEATTPFPYPLVSHVDESGVSWLTDNEGKKLYRWRNGKKLNDMEQLLFPVYGLPIRTIFTRQNEIWLGNENGLTVINTNVSDPALNIKPKLYIRSVSLGNDSTLWGGFGDMPEMLPRLKHQENNLKITFSLDLPPIALQPLYRYRLNKGTWSSWSTSTEAIFVNLSHGDYTFSVQARVTLNHITDISSIKFHIDPPFYYKWYMIVLYLLLLGTLFLALFQLRLRRLRDKNIRLEKLVKDRSAEVVRLEKMATAGKLTQGLIDRILNPLNYINNFAKLSEGLVKDVKDNVEAEKEHMEEENYEDTIDVLNMLTGNLQKVGEHGQNTTRTLKAMEEMLKDRSGGIVPMDLMAVIRQDKEMLHEYYKKEIAQYGIKIVFDNTEGELPINGNADQLSKTLMSLLGNAVYAVMKKTQKLQSNEESQDGTTAYRPEIDLHIAKQHNNVRISIHDNGIGIEKAILEKIFDPFFTTKPTGEAAGTGLYLSREIVQNHGGDIQVKSVKDEYSEFIITIPIKKA